VSVFPVSHNPQTRDIRKRTPIEAETFGFALPALSAVRDKWMRLPGGKIPSQEPQIIEFLTDIFRCYGKEVVEYQIKIPYYLTTDIWSGYRISINIPDAENIFTTADIEVSEGCITFYSESETIPSTLNLNEEEYRIYEETGDYGLFRFQSALIAPRSPPEWISDRKM